MIQPTLCVKVGAGIPTTMVIEEYHKAKINRSINTSSYTIHLFQTLLYINLGTLVA